MRAVYLEADAVSRNDLDFSPITSVVDTTIFGNTTEQDKYEHIGDSEIVFANKILFDEETFQRCPGLKYIGVCATGYNVIDLEAARRHGVTVTNVPAYSTESVAQLTWGLILDNASRISLHDRSVHAGDWIKSQSFCYWLSPVVELAGKTIGIVGYGNIGKRVAEIARAFHMEVLVHTAHPENYAGNAPEGIRFVTLSELFAGSDVITLHCPLTAGTKEMICSETIGQMKDGVMFINVSRGGLVREADLAEALRSGKVSAAAVDVVSVEPMREDNPLLKAPDMIITPHIAWASLEARKRLIGVVASNLQAWLDGKPVNVCEA